MAKYVKDNGLVSPLGENAILFAAEYFRLKELSQGYLSEHDKMLIGKAINSQKVDKDEFRAIPEEINSHDNHSALMSLSKQAGLDLHNRFFWKHWWRRIHPRDLIYYVWLRDDILSLLALPFLPVLSIIMIVSCLDTRTKHFLGKDRLRTDGKLLAWLRLNTISLPITKKICDFIVAKKFGNWYNVFKTYFWQYSDKHPIRKLSKELYGKEEN